MFIDELTPERRDEMIEWMAGKVHDWGMITPAMLATEGFRPISFLVSQAVHFVAPMGDAVTGHPYASELGFLLQDRENLDRFMHRLEELSEDDENGEDNEDSNEDDAGDDPDDGCGA